MDPYDKEYTVGCINKTTNKLEKISWPQVRDDLRNIKRGGAPLLSKVAAFCTAVGLCNAALMIGSVPYLGAEPNNKVPNLREQNNCPLTSFDNLIIELSPVFYANQLLASSYQLKSSLHFEDCKLK